MHKTDEATLVEGARAGDVSSCERLFERYQSKIYNYAYGICGNPDDAQDVTQDAFTKVLAALPHVEGDVNFSAYLYRTAHNVAIDLVKGGARFAAPEALDLQLDKTISADPERVALLAEQQEQVRGAAFHLSDDLRSVLALRELEGLSYAQIGEVLDMPKNTVGVLLSRARLKFKGAYRMSQVDVDKLTQECRKMLPMLSAYIDDELATGERERMKTHLDDCAFCRLALEEMTESSQSYRGLIPLIPVAGMKGNVLSRLAELGAMPDGTANEVHVPAEKGGRAGSENELSRVEVHTEAGGPGSERSADGSGSGSVASDAYGGKGGGGGGLSTAQKGLLGAAAIAIAGGILLGLLVGAGIVKAGPGLGRLAAVEKLCAGELREDATLILPAPAEQASKEDVAQEKEPSSVAPSTSSGSSTGSSGDTSGTISPDGDGSTLGDQPGDTNLPDPVPPETPQDPQPPEEPPY